MPLYLPHGFQGGFVLNIPATELDPDHVGPLFLKILLCPYASGSENQEAEKYTKPGLMTEPKEWISDSCKDK